MAKEKNISIRKDIAKALRRFPQVVKTQERRAVEQRKFLKKTFGPLVRNLKKAQKDE